MNDAELIATLTSALRELYGRACHHPKCDRAKMPQHACKCGVSAALENARLALSASRQKGTPT